ncbi:SAM-dependent methyltransferase [Actinomadura sp. 9N215]|uniref:SAM-dependent methyltransferase n=1 Tax=Actinomadura sp. 9N215 TaxID=3375150 RepID=UPI0037BA6F28
MSAHDTTVHGSAAAGDLIELDESTPVMARLWNLWANGKDAGPAEQQFGERVQQLYPQILDVARFRLVFRARAVRVMVEEYRLRQLLVVGVDVPLRDEVHEIAQRIDPATRVVYADTDAWVMMHARALLTSRAPGGCAHVDADLYEPGVLLDQAAATLSLAEPVGVLLTTSLDGVDDQTAAHALAVLRTVLPGGSCIGICHLAGDTGQGLGALGGLWDRPIPGLPHARTLDGIRALFTDLDVAEPGLVAAPHWRPEPSPWAPLEGVDLWCGVGRVRARTGARVSHQAAGRSR